MTISIPDLSAAHVDITGDTALITPDQSEFKAVVGSADVLKNGGEVRILAFCEGPFSIRIIDKLNC